MYAKNHFLSCSIAPIPHSLSCFRELFMNFFIKIFLSWRALLIRDFEALLQLGSGSIKFWERFGFRKTQLVVINRPPGKYSVGYKSAPNHGRVNSLRPQITRLVPSHTMTQQLKLNRHSYSSLKNSHLAKNSNLFLKKIIVQSFFLGYA